jgi:hypothetical protein
MQREFTPFTGGRISIDMDIALSSNTLYEKEACPHKNPRAATA